MNNHGRAMLKRNVDDYWEVGYVIANWQIKNGIDNESLAFRSGVSVRTLERVKSGMNVRLSTLEDILWEMGYELKACPIGHNCLEGANK